MPLINREIGLNWSKKCFIVVTDVVSQGVTFSITDTKLYVPVVTLSTQDNVKLLKQLKSGFEITINWNKYQSKISTEIQNQYLYYLIDLLNGLLSFQGVKRHFVLSLEFEAQRTS